MYSKTDLLIIGNGYFTDVSLNEDNCILKSNNTKHSWRIMQSSDGYFSLWHKHRDKDEFHFHRGCVSIEDCILEIIDHDEFQLRGRKPNLYVSRTIFEDVVDTYNNACI